MDGQIQVLLVDDEPLLLDVIKESLESMAPTDVTTCQCVDEAMTLLKERSFDVVVSDYQMPVKNGLEFLSEVRRTVPGLPFILFTGRGREEVVIEALNRGADYYLQKGGDPNSQFTELIHMITLAVKSRSAVSELKASEKKNRSFVHNMKGIVYRYRIDDRKIDLIDGEVETYTGFSSRDYLDGMVEWGSTILPEDRDLVKERHRAILASEGERFELRYHLVHKDGTVRLVSDVAHMISDDGGPDCVMGLINDITEKERLERALNDSESRWKFALEGSGDGLWDWDPISNTTYYSPRWKSVLGYENDDVGPEMNEWRSRLHSEDLPHVEKALKRFISGESENYEVEHRLRCKDGSYKWVLARGMVVSKDRNGRPTRIIGTHTDIDQFKRNEEMLQARISEVTVKEIALCDSEETFRSFVNESHDGIFLIDENGRVIEWNRAMSRITGVERQDAIGEPYIDLMVEKIGSPNFTPENIEKLRNDTEGARLAGDSEFFYRSMDVEIFRKGGQTAFIQQNIFPIRVKDGFRIGSIVRDITERKRTEKVLEETGDLFRAVVDSSYDAIFIHDTEGRVVDVNNRLCEMYRVSREKALTLTIRDFSDEEMFDVQVRTGVWKRTLEGENFLFPWKAKRPTDGSLFDVEVYLTRVKSGDETLFMATTRDVTERKKAEKALKEAEENYRRLVQNIHETIYTIQMDGTITYVSPSWKDQLGYDESEHIGRPFNDLIHPDDRRPCHEFLTRTAEGLVRQPAIEYRIFHKDGSIRWHRSNLIPLLDDDGKLISLIGTAVDITDYKMTGDALALSNRKLNLLSSITRHDILNQIMVVQGNIALAKMANDPTKQMEHCDKIGKAIEIIQRQIEFTRDYERLGVHQPTWHSLWHLMDGVDGNDIAVELELDDVLIFADSMIETVFQNLMDNTVRHAERATKVVVRGRPTEDGRFVITWEDDGVGVAWDQKERIFERGFGKNTGLGLFLIREILDITKITIEENGEPDKGVRFEIVLPPESFRFEG